ncbi:hypothetical protein ACFYM3_07610 [Streptomyces massasporeus]|uniref:Secreted protein n=1 Tax=Streptomyces massasporeus TaxID=67324 RepID=A0ABW6LBQ0_9ACTN
MQGVTASRRSKLIVGLAAGCVLWTAGTAHADKPVGGEATPPPQGGSDGKGGLSASVSNIKVTYPSGARGSRFLSWDGGKRTPGSEAVLWSVPREEIAGAELKRFSTAESDFRISFRDGSWATLTSSPHGARRIVALLSQGVPESGPAPARP